MLFKYSYYSKLTVMIHHILFLLTVNIYGQNFTKIISDEIVNDQSPSIGCSWGDYDNDGDLDLFVTNIWKPNLLFANNGDGTFRKIVTGNIVSDSLSSNSSSWADYDNDGDLDLFVANGAPFTLYIEQNNVLYSNNGNASFTKMIVGDIFEDRGNSKTCNWSDYDNDGDLDIFVTNQGLGGLVSSNNFLYANNNDGNFTKVTHGDIINDVGSSYCSSWGDIDNDGDLDLFVANISGNNFLYLNKRYSTFTKITKSNVVNENSNSFGSSIADYDNDGDLDLFVTNFNENNLLYSNNGDGTFTKIIEEINVNDGGLSFGSSWGDYDNDGDLDLFVTNAGENNFLYSNNGDGTFTKIIEGIIVNENGSSFGCSWADIDNDGDLDLFVSNANKYIIDPYSTIDIDTVSNENNFLYVNNGNNNHWLKIKCIGTFSNKSAIGAKVKVKAEINGISVWQMREIAGQTGFGGQNSMIAHFGLGNATVVELIEIEWTSGYVWDTTNVDINQFITVTEKPFNRITLGDMDTGNLYTQNTCAWGDYSNDGYLDFYVSGGNLYHSNGNGTFTKITSSPIVIDKDGAGCWSDYDNDGYLDLYVFGGYIFQNTGNSTFNKITAGPIIKDGGGIGSWGDYDNDGNLDIFITSRSFFGLQHSNFLYSNNGDGSFNKILTGEIVNNEGLSMVGNWGDYDNDNDIDLFVANFDENNFLYQNNGNGSFTKKIKTGGVVEDRGGSLGGSWGDYDNDGDLDLFVINKEPSESIDTTGASNFLYLNNGNNNFTKVTTGDIVNDRANSYGCCWGDFDNDGDLDLFVANRGIVFHENAVIPENNFLYQNNGDGTFNRKTSGYLVEDDESSEGCAWGDYDNDGDLDLILVNRTNITLFVNNKNSNNWINVKCTGTTSNTSAIGTKIKVLANIHGKSIWQLREISATTGNGAQNSLNAEFGLGDAAAIDFLIITWPTGITQAFADVPVNQFFKVTENISPIIEHIPHVKINKVGQDVSIEANVIDESEDLLVILHYRKGGDSKFTDIKMLNIGGSFRGIIPGAMFSSKGVEYFISVTDEFGLTAHQPSVDIFSIQTRVGTPGIVKGSAQINGSDQTAYRMISMPINLDNKNSTAILENDLGKYNKKKWRLYELKKNQLYEEYPNISNMESGKAFWLIVKEQNKIIKTGPGVSNPTDEPFFIPLHPGWNLIGNPFNFDIPVDNLSLKSGQQLDIRTYIGNWEDLFSPIQPFEGYAVANDSSDSVDTLIVDPLISLPSYNLPKKTNSTNSRTAIWSVRILAQCQQARDIDNIAAVMPEAANGLDKMDRPEPPLIGEYVSVYFPHPEWRTTFDKYSADVRPTAKEGSVWEFEIITNIRDIVNLTFEEIEIVPEDYEIFLVDEVLNVTQNLRQFNSYSVAGLGPNTPKPLKLIIGTHNFLQEKLDEVQTIPIHYELSQNFPNPFNLTTTIQYGLPRESNVTLKIYNILGKEVITLINDEKKKTGYHFALWNGRNQNGHITANGLYFYKIQAGEFTMCRKMILLK